MRILAAISLLFLINLPLQADLPADTLEIAYTELDSKIESFLLAAHSNGHWNARAEVLSLPDSSGKILVVFTHGESVLLKHIHFVGADEKESRFLKREVLRNRGGVSPAELHRTEAVLQALGYVSSGMPQISVDSQRQYHVRYQLQSKPKLRIDALAAFSQNASADTLEFFGHLDLSVPNLDGNGKSIRLNWKRLDRESELLELSYRHPWLFQAPLAVMLGFSREVVEGNFQILNTDLGLEWAMDWDRSLLLTFEDHQSIITFEGRSAHPEWSPLRRQSIGIGYKQAGIDRHRGKGFSLRTTLHQELEFEASSNSRLEARSEFLQGIYRNIAVEQRTAVIIQTNAGAPSDPSLMKPLGGIHTVRGYPEQFLRSSSIAALQHDLNLKLGSTSRIFALVDMGFYGDGNDVKKLTGYGFGAQLGTAQGPIRIIFATHSGLSIQNSFLHIQYSGEVNWIDR